MYRYLICLTLILSLAAALPSVADSLWSANTSNMCTDLTARKVGDLVTVLVVEGTVSTMQASSNFNKSADHKNNAGIGPLLNLVPDLTFKSGQSGSAGGQTTLTNNLVTKLTTVVQSVLPNGNFQISGERMLDTNGEKQGITLTAIVRPQDISPDNTVASTYLANIDCKCIGKGPIDNRQREGIISRLLGFVF